jgi:hypothetical protein
MGLHSDPTDSDWRWVAVDSRKDDKTGWMLKLAIETLTKSDLVPCPMCGKTMTKNVKHSSGEEPPCLEEFCDGCGFGGERSLWEGTDHD